MRGILTLALCASLSFFAACASSQPQTSGKAQPETCTCDAGCSCGHCMGMAESCTCGM